MRLLFVVTEDWFFRSHFLPFADAAQAAGFEITVICRCGAARAELEAHGFAVIPLAGARSHFSFASLWREAAAIRRQLKEKPADIVHFIALRPILLGLFLSLAAPRRRCVFSLTGRGFTGIDPSPRGRLLRLLLRRLAPFVAARRPSFFLFENRDDPAFLGLDPQKNANLGVVGGAGVDPDAWPVAPLPAGETLNVAFIGRMLRFKGVGDLVEAVGLARAAGQAIELSLYGAPDADNPASLAPAEIEAWGRRDGVLWHGRTRDVAGAWAKAHVAVQPSHAGEGLPLALLEAAACGRALVATDTPGCRDFVRDGIDGLIVPPRRPDRIAAALVRLAADRGLVEKLAAAARRRILDGFTRPEVTAEILAVYQRLLRLPPSP